MLEAHHAHSVIDAEALHHFALGGVEHAAFGQAAINVREKEFDIGHFRMIICHW